MAFLNFSLMKWQWGSARCSNEDNYLAMKIARVSEAGTSITVPVSVMLQPWQSAEPVLWMQCNDEFHP